MDATSLASTSSDMGNTKVDDDLTPSTSSSETTVINTVCSKQDTETKACYICNVHVPVTYFYEHKNCRKHKNWFRLMQIMLERYRLHCKQQETLNDTSSSTYYCEPCDCIVETLNRSIHEGSKSHLEKTQYNKLLHIFVSKINTTQLQGLETVAVIQSNIEKDDANDIKDEAKEVYAKKKYDSLDQYVHMYKKIFKVIINLLENEVEIFIRTKCLRIKENDFHGIVTDDEGLKCDVCESRISQVEKHKSSLKHVRKLGTSLMGLVDDFFSVDGDIINCSECVVNFETSRLTAHLSSKHYKSISHYQITLEFDDDNLDEKCEEVEDNMLELLDVPKEDIREDYSCFTSGNHPFLYCIVCNEYVDNSMLDEHILSAQHIAKYGILLNLQRIEEVSHCLSMCKVCFTVMLKRNVISHIKEKSHIEKLALNPHEQDTSEEVELHYCYVCNMYMTNDYTVISEHNQTSTHIDIQFEVNYQFIVLESESTLILRCKVCNRDMKYSRQEMEDHLESYTHQSAYTYLLELNHIEAATTPNQFFCEVCTKTIDLYSEIDHIYSSIHEKKCAQL